jgi:DUF3040 family protein
MADHGTLPLDTDEARALRAIAQELTRAEPDLLSEPTCCGARASLPQLIEFGVYLLAIGLVAGLITASLGPLPAFVVGAGLLVAATVKAATSRPV